MKFGIGLYSMVPRLDSKAQEGVRREADRQGLHRRDATQQLALIESLDARTLAGRVIKRLRLRAEEKGVALS